MMRAIVQNRYGAPDAVLRIGDVEIPTPAPDEVLVCVRAASVHADVWHVVTGFPRVLPLMGAGWRQPKQPIPGLDMAGIVEAVGSDVVDLTPGDAVFGETHRQMQWINGGAYAEYVSVPADILARKPDNITFEQAASVPTAGMIAVSNLQKHFWSEPGQRVLINGAAGGVGSIAIQLAKARGAIVTGVDHAETLDFMRSLGADEVVDYKKEDITQRGERYDFIVDVASTLAPSGYRRLLDPRGIYVIIGHDHYGTKGRRTFGNIPRMLVFMARSLFDSHLPKPELETPSKGEMMEILRRMLEEETLTPVIDRTFSLEEVPAALRYLQEERALGKILVVP